MLALAAAGAAAGDIWVHFAAPADGSMAIGAVVMEAEVVSTRPVREVVFFVDGRPVGALMAKPFRLEIDLGGDNREHRLAVTAEDIDGSVARQEITVAPVPVADRVDVELQQLYVTVRRGEQQVRDLRRDEVTVFDAGRPQEIVTFAHGDVPFTAVLLIDASASMSGGKLAAAASGAKAFVAGMRELDRSRIVVFSDVIRTMTPFSARSPMLTAALAGISGRGGTALSDTLYAALKMLERRQGRRVIVVLSDGVDGHSALGIRPVLDRARHSQALVYWIRLRAGGGDVKLRLASAWRNAAEFEEQTELLSRLVTASGGRTLQVSGAEGIRPVFLDILNELRGQYALGYYPDNRRNDGSWHPVEVRALRPGLTVRTHAGYIDYR